MDLLPIYAFVSKFRPQGGTGVAFFSRACAVDAARATLHLYLPGELRKKERRDGGKGRTGKKGEREKENGTHKLFVNICHQPVGRSSTSI